MFCNIMLCIVASELINCEIKYLYMYCFGRSCNTCIWSISKVILMIGMTIMPQKLPSASRIPLSALSLK